MAPPLPVQLYQLNELENGVLKISEILDRIKTELKIESFLSLTNYLEKLYESIVAQQDIARKTLAFMDGVSKVPQNKS